MESAWLVLWFVACSRWEPCEFCGVWEGFWPGFSSGFAGLLDPVPLLEAEERLRRLVIEGSSGDRPMGALVVECRGIHRRGRSGPAWESTTNQLEQSDSNAAFLFL